jgi:Reverse transcriptase (RNA-dependent DNA polymerase).
MSAYVSWFRNFLTGVSSYVKISGVLSLPLRVICGVQGSVLGPLLFNMFIDDTCNVITHHRFLLFANSMTIFHVLHS